jgi:tRNA-2-methylthio-N6-dimethylallyladenosine synthase
MDLVRESRFKNSFIFKYSERPGTKGAELYADDIPEDVKRRRNNELLALQNEISEADNQPFLGQQVTVLVEGPSKVAEKQQGVARPESAMGVAKIQTTPFEDSGRATRPDTRHPTPDTLQLTGRTHCDRIVVFTGNRRQIGHILPIVIYDANAHTLFGEVVTRHIRPELYTLAAPV